jgi:hypothetical protein
MENLSGGRVPSKGFMKASLAIVAQAPLVAIHLVSTQPSKTAKMSKSHLLREGGGLLRFHPSAA